MSFGENGMNGFILFIDLGLYISCQVEAVMNDFIQLKPQSSVYEAETMVEGQHSFFFFFFSSIQVE